jgi:hypothetical protein
LPNVICPWLQKGGLSPTIATTLRVPVMIVVCVQWQSEIMTVLQGDFEEELRRMSVDRAFDRPEFRDPLTTRESLDEQSSNPASRA